MLNIKKIKPMWTSIVTTMDRELGEKYTKGGLIAPTSTKGSIKEFQKVVSIGDSVRGIKVGDLICINPERFAVKQHKEGSLKDGIVTDNPTISYNFEIIELDSIPHLIIQDRDIRYIVEEFEEIEIPQIYKQTLLA